jgi:polysaccharide biosynthesis protein PslH
VRPSILFLSQCLPYPPDSGVTRRTHNILLQLQKEFDIFALCYARRNHQPRAPDIEVSQRKLASQLTAAAPPVRVKGDWSPIRRASDLLLSYATGKPYVFFQYRSPRYRDLVANGLKHFHPDLVHLDSLDLYRWLKLIPGDIPVACTHHDIESRLLARRALSSTNPVMAQVFRRQSRLYENLERRLAPQLALNVVMSEVDGAHLSDVAPGVEIAVVPNGVDVDTFRTMSLSSHVSPSPVVLFMGPTYMDANRDAVEHFVEHIWPDVLIEFPNARFVLIGRTTSGMESFLRQIPNVEVRGYVDDVRAHIAAASCFVVPIRVGGGTRLKILEGWAMGVPIVSTTIGCEGLAAVHGKNILVADKPAEFAHRVKQILGQPTMGRDIGSAGRRTAETLYSWDKIGLDLRMSYRGLMSRGRHHRS